jgi:hypothetical protein
MTQFTSLLTSTVIILTVLAIVWWCYFTDKSQFIVHHNDAPNLDFRYGSGVDKSAPHGTTKPESFCSGKWNPDMYLPVTGPLRFPFPERRLQSWYLPEAYWGDKPRFDYAFREDSDGKLTPVWPNAPIKPRMASAEY